MPDKFLVRLNLFPCLDRFRSNWNSKLFFRYGTDNRHLRKTSTNRLLSYGPSNAHIYNLFQLSERYWPLNVHAIVDDKSVSQGCIHTLACTRNAHTHNPYTHAHTRTHRPTPLCLFSNDVHMLNRNILGNPDVVRLASYTSIHSVHPSAIIMHSAQRHARPFRGDRYYGFLRFVAFQCALLFDPQKVPRATDRVSRGHCSHNAMQNMINTFGYS